MSTQFKLRECYVCRRRHLGYLDRCNECSGNFERKATVAFTVLLICVLSVAAYAASL